MSNQELSSKFLVKLEKDKAQLESQMNLVEVRFIDYSFVQILV